MRTRTSVSIAALMWIVTCITLVAQTAVRNCSPLEEQSRARILQQAARVFHTEPSLPTVDRENVVPGTCYLQMLLSQPTTNRRWTLYVSPDRRFISGSLWDISERLDAGDAKAAQELEQRNLDVHAPVRGPELAPVTVVVFSDFQCPYCSSFNRILEQYRSTHPSQIRVIFRNLPLISHNWAGTAAKAALCVGEQDKSAFWKVHDFFFSEQETLTSESLMPKLDQFLMQLPNIKAGDLYRCMVQPSTDRRLAEDVADAAQRNLHGTPTVFINGRQYGGFRDETSFASAVQLALDKSAGKSEGQ